MLVKPSWLGVYMREAVKDARMLPACLRNSTRAFQPTGPLGPGTDDSFSLSGAGY